MSPDILNISQLDRPLAREVKEEAGKKYRSLVQSGFTFTVNDGHVTDILPISNLEIDDKVKKLAEKSPDFYLVRGLAGTPGNKHQEVRSIPGGYSKVSRGGSR